MGHADKRVEQAEQERGKNQKYPTHQLSEVYNTLCHSKAYDE